MRKDAAFVFKLAKAVYEYVLAGYFSRRVGVNVHSMYSLYMFAKPGIHNQSRSYRCDRLAVSARQSLTRSLRTCMRVHVFALLREF